MADRISIGDPAPNFDLTSTEGSLLMLRDEVPRTAVVLYFFSDAASERARRDLQALGKALAALRKLHAKVLGVSRSDLAILQKLQAELKLPFPLLHDDRDFSSRYGVAPPAEGQEPAPALYVVNRQQNVLWLSNPVAAVEQAMPEVLKSLEGQGSPTGNYPRAVINRLVDRWVN
jgi:peroxiredoxin Q/BCP